MDSARTGKKEGKGKKRIFARSRFLNDTGFRATETGTPLILNLLNN